MKVLFKKKDITTCLQHCVAVAEKKTTMPILGNILWTAKNKKTMLCATDLEITIQSEMKAVVEKEGQICVPAQHLMNIIKELPQDDVVVEADEQSWVKISSGKAQFKIAGISGEEFPKLAQEAEFQFQNIHRDTLLQAFEKTAYAICTDEMRYNLNGSLIETETTQSGKKIIKVVSTDGHRLAYYHVSLDTDETFNVDKGVIFPRKGIMELKKLIHESSNKEVQIAVQKGTAAILIDNIFLTMKLVVGEFPDYTAVIPKNNNKKLKLNRSHFTNSLRRVSLLSEGKSKCVKFGIHGKGVLLKANSPELGEAEEEIMGEFDGGELTIGFNAKYVMDVLSSVHSDQIVLELNHEQSPGVFRIPDDPSFFGVIMPMRI
ncbi:MAG: DNA polymerase III subunit beta [Bdellovibrionales bacterium]|nr:DNA polymerase III subunit beta [Bdellovibrionales bacterium]